jgi:integrase
VPLPEGIHTVRAGGRTYYYWHPGRGTASAGQRRRIPGDPSDPAFWAFLGAAGADIGDEPGTLAHALEAWQTSPAWAALSPVTRDNYDRYATAMLDRWADWAMASIGRAELTGWRRSYGDRVQSANAAMAVARSFWGWAINEQLAAENPAAGIQNHRTSPRQAPPWPQWALRLTEDHPRWEIRAFVALARYTGQRTADIVAMTLRQFAGIPASGGRVEVIQAKTGTALSIPMHPRLARIVDEARARGSIAVFPARDGRPISAENFRGTFRREMARPAMSRLRAAGLSPHGLRALVTNHLLEVGCTEAQVSAITGMSMGVVARYARARDQVKLSDQAMAKWTEGDR